MPISLSALRPYKSLILAAVKPDASPVPTVGKVLDDIARLLSLDTSVNRRLITRSRTQKSAELSVAFIHYVERALATWSLDPTLIDELNHLILVCRRNRHLAIYLSDPRWRGTVTQRFDRSENEGLAALQRIPPGLLNAAFVKGPARTLWLSGAHRRTSVKADSKILSGIELRDALDPLGDQTYFFTAARCVTDLEGESLPVGVSPRASRVWLGPTRDWEDFRETITHLLAHTEAVTQPERAPLPVVAVSSIDPTRIENGFDVALIPPEVITDDPSIDVETRENVEIWAYHSDFRVLEATGPNLTAEVALDGETLGTVEFDVDLTMPDSVSWTAIGTPASQATSELHEKALKACSKPSWVKIYYESGHTLTNGQIFEMRFRDIPFQGFLFADFSGYDVDQEKPKPLDLPTIGTQTSLFDWVKNVWPPLGYGFPTGCWLTCDDGSMDIADFIHLDDSGQRTGHHSHSCKGGWKHRARSADFCFQV
jgi:hypothetical protein